MSRRNSLRLPSGPAAWTSQVTPAASRPARRRDGPRQNSTPGADHTSDGIGVHRRRGFRRRRAARRTTGDALGSNRRPRRPGIGDTGPTRRPIRRCWARHHLLRGVRRNRHGPPPRSPPPLTRAGSRTAPDHAIRPEPSGLSNRAPRPGDLRVVSRLPSDPRRTPARAGGPDRRERPTPRRGSAAPASGPPSRRPVHR
jgi:hypothetical protein